MPRRFWARIALVAAVVALSIFYLYPPQRTINLGLDLQGGIHLVLGVDADKAVANQTDRLAEDLKAALERRGIGVNRVVREGDQVVIVQLANPQSWNDALSVAGEFTIFDRTDDDQAAGRFRLVMKTRDADRVR